MATRDRDRQNSNQHEFSGVSGSPDRTSNLKRPRQASVSSIESLRARRVRVQEEHDARKTLHEKVYERNTISGPARAHFGDQHFHGPVEQHIHDDSTYSGLVGQERAREILTEKLKFDQMGSRLATIAKVHPSTCQWLFERPEYRTWSRRECVDDHNGILWIKAKPGAGKSTMMKFIHDDLKRRSDADIVISFFYNARGHVLEKSAEGMYRALLYQILNELPDLRKLLDRRELTARIMAWPVELLKELLSDAVMNSKPRRLACYIDALDECNDDEMRDMVSFFEILAESAVLGGVCLYICFASRHFPHISLQKRIELVLEDQSGHQRDISLYITKNLRLGSSEMAGDIKNQVQNRAAGVFLWVVLVVQILNKEYDRGRVYALQARLNKIPSSLSELFKDLLLRDVTDKDELLLTLQWILCSIRPLTATEVYYAVRLGMDPESVKVLDVYESKEDMARFILDCSRGLAELSQGRYVQFIHESVKDYLLKEMGIRTIAPHLEQNFFGLTHDRLRKCCSEYISIDFAKLLDLRSSKLPEWRQFETKQRDRLFRHFPLLKYAVDNVLKHADAASEHGISQNDFVRTFPSGDWLLAHNAIAVERVDLNVDKVHMFAERQHFYLLRDALQQRSNEPDKSHANELALLAAVTHGNHTILELLLDHGSFVEARGAEILKAAERAYNPNVLQLLLRCSSLEFDSEPGVSLLSQAIQKHHTDVVQHFNNKHISRQKARGRTLWEPLQYTIIRNSTECMRVLLDLGADINAQIELDAPDKTTESLLALAAGRGNEEMIQMLIQRGADVNICGGTPLQRASEAGHFRIVQSLLSSGAQPIGQAVWAALTHSHGDVVGLLLKNGADPHELNAVSTPLLAAICRGDSESVQELLKAGEDPNAASKGWVPLHVAANLGQHTIVEALLTAGARVDTLGPDVRPFEGSIAREAGAIRQLSVLQFAAERGDSVTVKLLLSHGADVNATGGYTYNATSLAFRGGHDDTVAILLSHGGQLIEDVTTDFLMPGETNDIVLTKPM